VDSRCPGPSSTITGNIFSPKFEVVTTKICCVLLLRRDVEDPPVHPRVHSSARARLHEPLCAFVVVATPMAAVRGPAPAITIIGWSLPGRYWV